MDKNKRLCPQCEKDIANGQCTNCGVMHYPTRFGTLNELGHCPDCQTEEEKYALTDESRSLKCINCKDTLIHLKNNMCNNCLTLQDTCPHCSENSKYVSEYACNKCKIMFMRTDKKYRLQQ